MLQAHTYAHNNKIDINNNNNKTNSSSPKKVRKKGKHENNVKILKPVQAARYENKTQHVNRV